MSKDHKPKIVIAGAGPAGTSLAIRLAASGYETVLIEKERFPREKLCGEFISPECLEHFQELGVLDSMMAGGGVRVRETRFFEAGGRSIAVPSSWLGEADSYALSLSRAEMDLRLLDRAKIVGVDVREGLTITDLRFDGAKASEIVGRTDDQAEHRIAGDIFVDATGRGAVLGRASKDRESHNHTRPQIVGFKSHIKGAALEKGVCEIYSFPGGYAGLSHVEGDKANLCFLIKSEVVRSVGSDALGIVDQVVRRNKRAASTLREIEPAAWLAVSITGFGRRKLALAPNVFSVGDAAAFIDPFTGSGMMMALESASVFTEALLGSRSLEDLPIHYSALYGRRFAARLRICSVLRRTAFMPRLASVLVGALSISSSARRILARSTRT